ncbi:MAG: hypothetical protein ACR2KT_01720 [Methylocella sp.]|nr:MAG: hypothetical protein DLM68_06055 [Hyphomicrobiales bacterium]
MTKQPKTHKAPAAKAIAPDSDPIFALIAAHKALIKASTRLNNKLDNAVFKAAGTHGRRPFEMILWRDCDAFSEEGVDGRREEFLSQPGADREQIETEYLDALARMADAERACAVWDERAGVAPLREQYEHTRLAEHNAAMRMARTKPTTPAGATALVDYVRRDIDIGQNTIGWPSLALKTVGRALAGMNAEARKEFARIGA